MEVTSQANTFREEEEAGCAGKSQVHRLPFCFDRSRDRSSLGCSPAGDAVDELHSTATIADATAVLSSFGCETEGKISRRLNSRRSSNMLIVS